MSIPHQKIIVPAIWGLFVANSLRQGLSLPSSELVAFAGNARPFGLEMALLGLLLPPACAFMSVSIFRFRARPSAIDGGRAWRWVDSRWGPGSAHGFLRALRPVALVALGAFVLGVVGLISCYRANAGASAYEIASFFLSGGLGFAIARLLVLRRVPESPV